MNNPKIKWKEGEEYAGDYQANVGGIFDLLVIKEGCLFQALVRYHNDDFRRLSGSRSGHPRYSLELAKRDAEHLMMEMIEDLTKVVCDLRRNLGIDNDY